MSQLVTALLSERGQLLHRFPASRAELRKGLLVWNGCLQPTTFSPVYRIRLVYEGRSEPSVRVVSPTLEPDEEGKLPHIYPDGSLCLYRAGEWRQGDSLADSIVPWTAEWLYFYELWRATGTWTGSGGNHTGHTLPRRQRRRRK